MIPFGSGSSRVSIEGGNVTGVTIWSGVLATKRLGLLHELIPRAKSIAVLIDLGFQPSERFHSDVEAGGRALGLSILRLEASNERAIEAAFDRVTEARSDALLVGPGPFLDSRRDLLVGLAAKVAIPAGFEIRATAVAGGLISYGASVEDGYRKPVSTQAASSRARNQATFRCRLRPSSTW